MWKGLMLFRILCFAVPVTPQSIGVQISSAELAKIEQTILENVRPAIISLTNRVIEEFTHSMEERLQKFLEREISIATSNHQQQTSLQANQISILQNEIKSLLKLTCAAGKGSVKDNFCFIFSSDSVTWYQARRNCRQRGGYLAIVNSQSITNFLNTMTVPGNDAFWIGGNDRRREGSWIWDESGQPIRYTNWDKTEPNDKGGEDCISLIKNKQGKWNDLSCTHARKYICQIALPSV